MKEIIIVTHVISVATDGNNRVGLFSELHLALVGIDKFCQKEGYTKLSEAQKDNIIKFDDTTDVVGDFLIETVEVDKDV